MGFSHSGGGSILPDFLLGTELHYISLPDGLCMPHASFAEASAKNRFIIFRIIHCHSVDIKLTAVYFLPCHKAFPFVYLLWVSTPERCNAVKPLTAVYTMYHVEHSIYAGVVKTNTFSLALLPLPILLAPVFREKR